MARVKLPLEKRRQPVIITIPMHLIQRIDSIQTTCNRSQLYESLLKGGLFYKEFKEHRDAIPGDEDVAPDPTT